MIDSSAPLGIASFSELLRRYRAAAGCTQEELAERASLSVRCISDLERGARQRPYPSTVRCLAQALRLSEADREELLVAAHGAGRKGSRPALSMVPVHISSFHSGSSRQALPDEPNRFIGRQREIDELIALLMRPAIRLVTITGPGGTGKTRLAIAAVRELEGNHRPAIHYVPLASLGRSEQVLPAIAEALNVPSGVDDVLPAIKRSLQHRSLLLVLDNFEHVLRSALSISALLDACPRLRVVVTSRVPLHLRREHEYLLAPLRAPESQTPSRVSEVRQYDAVALFEERARAVRAGFTVDESNVLAVCEICRQLDGLPLAIELAASRVRHVQPGALLQRLTESALDLDGALDLPDRHRTLRRTIEWSFALLDDREQRLFAALSVFVGGCTFEAARAVCGAAIGGEVTHGVDSLVDKNLAHVGGSAEPRILMLQTLREFAAERLAEYNQTVELRSRHLQYFVTLSEQAREGLCGPLARDWISRLQNDLDNIRAALAWSVEHDPSAGTRLMTATIRFWRITDRGAEGRGWFNRLFTEADRVEAAVVSRAAIVSETLFLTHDRSDSILRQAVAYFRETGDMPWLVPALCSLAERTSYADRHDEAQTIVDEAASLAGHLNDAALRRSVMGTVANLAKWRGDLEYAQGVYEELLNEYRAQRDPWYVLSTVHQLAEIAALRWDGYEAMKWGLEELERARELDRPADIRSGHLTLSYGLFILQRPAEALEHAVASLQLGQAVGLQEPLVLEELALCSGVLCRHELAARLWGVVDGLRRASGVAAPEIARDIYQPYMDQTRGECGEDTWLRAFVQGQVTGVCPTLLGELEEIALKERGCADSS